MRATPLQTVKKSFESRAKLVAELASTVDKLHGDTTVDQVKSRLMGLSNQKLLRLYRVEQKVRERFGDRDKLIAHLVDARKKAGLTAGDAYRAKLETFPKARLLDLANQKHGERPAKQTAAEKTKKRHGRKEKAREVSAKARPKA